MADGTKVLSVSMEDGTSYGAPLADGGIWTVEEDKGCIDPEGDGEDQQKFCFTYGPVAEDGTYEAMGEDGTVEATLKPLLASMPVGEVPPFQAGSVLVTFPDGTTGLNVWTADGNSYYAESPVAGTWRVDGEKRCAKLETEEEEGCGTPGAIAEDGSFTGNLDNGDTITVMPIS
jgi:hypothetical protein